MMIFYKKIYLSSLFFWYVSVLEYLKPHHLLENLSQIGGVFQTCPKPAGSLTSVLDQFVETCQQITPHFEMLPIMNHKIRFFT